MSERKVADAKDACELVRKYAELTSSHLYWRDVVECTYDDKGDEWRVTYEASPSLVAPYYKYEAIVDARSGAIKLVKRIER